MVYKAVALVLMVATLGIGVMFFVPGRPLAVVPAPQVSSGGTVQQTTAFVPDNPKGKKILEFTYMPDNTVAYSYVGAPLPEQLDPAEVPEMRTEQSYTKFVKVDGAGDTATYTMAVVSYPQKTFIRDATGWHYREYGQTSVDLWRMRPVSILERVRELFVQTAYADTAAPFSGAGDGDQEADTSDVLPNCDVWGQEAPAFGSDTGSTALIKAMQRGNVSGCSVVRSRVFLPFDTSAIPAGAIISAATLSIWATAKADSVNDGLDYITVTQTSQASSASLDVGGGTDWGSVSGEGIAAGQRSDLTSLTTGAYTTFTLNATGLGWIKKNGQTSNCGTTPGFTCLGALEGHDFTNTDPGSSVLAGNSATISMSENTGTTQDPFLSVTYTAPSTIMRLPLKGATIQVKGGKLKISSF